TPDHDPAGLLDAARFPTAEAIEDHLLDAFVPAVYQQPHPTRNGNTKRRPRDGPADAHRWHTYVATHLQRLGTNDLAWWGLRDTIPVAARVLTLAAAVGLAGGLMVGLTEG